MILFINLTGQMGQGRHTPCFAYIDTFWEQFVELNSNHYWETWEAFATDFESDERGYKIADFKALVPRGFFIPPLTKAQRDRAERLKQANELLEVIASYGRRFFYHNDRVSKFDVDRRGRIWFVDAYSDSRIYVAIKSGDWRGFSEGGTLRALVSELADYVQKGRLVPTFRFGPWEPDYCNGDLWGYGADMAPVRDRALNLGIIKKHE